MFTVRIILAVSLLALPVLLLPIASSQSYSTVTSTVTTEISNTQTNSIAIGSTSLIATSRNVIYTGSFSLVFPSGNYCGIFEYIPFQATAGEQIQGTINSTVEVNFYLISSHAYNMSGLNSGTGGRCGVSSDGLQYQNTRSKAFAYTVPTDDKYYFIVYLVSGATADVTIDAYSTSVQTFPSAIYSSTTNVIVATLTQTLSSVYTQQPQTLPGGTNNFLIIAALGAIVIAAVAAYHSRKKKKAETGIQAEEQTTCRKCGGKLLPKAKFCKKCGTPT